MPDKKFTELDSQTTPLPNDIFPFVTNPAGTPTAKKTTFTNIEASLNLANQIGKDTDITLAANSDSKFPTQKAVKAYADTKDQLTFKTVAISGQSGIVANSTTSTLTFIPGTNVSLISSPSNGSVTISASGGRGAISGDISIPDGSNLSAITSGAIVNSDISFSAAIDPIKIGSGDVNALKFHYLSGVTSDIQSQFNNRIISGSLDTDTTLSSNSDLRIPTQKAVKAYVDGNIVAGGGGGGGVSSGVSNGPAVNLGGGTGLVFGKNYYDLFTGDRTLGFSGTPLNGLTCSVKFVVSGAARTIGFPSSQREGGNGTPITSLLFQQGDHELSWVKDNNKYWLVDTASSQRDVWTLPISDEISDLSTGTNKVTFRAPRAATITKVRFNVNTASSSGNPTVDINKEGVSILSTKLSINVGEKTSVTATTQAVISDSSILDDAEITIDLDAAGTGTKGGKVYIYVVY